MATVPDTSGGTKTQPSNVVDSRAFLLLLGQVIGVLILAWAASFSERVGYVVIAFLAVLWLLFLMNRSDLIAVWGAKLGLPQPSQTVVVQ